jgi:deoxyribodipyrimidine photo-lyase
MVDIASFFEREDRVYIYRPGVCSEEGRCVLYWMQRAQREQENQALNAAIALANELDLPTVVLFVISDYPAANLRHYYFMLEGLVGVADGLKKRGSPLVIRKGQPEHIVIELASQLSAAAVISDECEMRLPRAWRATLRKHLTIPFACVDADVVIPSKHLTKEEWAARTIRPKIHRLLPLYLQPVIDLQPAQRLEQPPCDTGNTANPLHYLDSLKIDRSVGPAGQFHGGQHEGKRRQHIFMQERLIGYAERRNHPEFDSTSKLSAYLHFGQISVQHCAWEIEQYVSTITGSAKVDIDGGRAAFLEELIVRRELASNFARHNPHYDTLAGCPAWAQETLHKHSGDPREWLYSRDALEQARTHDELWNACQREMIISGRMHGYMRMYWAKKILEWTASPEEAFANAVYLNDKYELDGRDANGYTGIAWAIGGKHDRPWGPERPIFGLVRYMALSGMKRKMDTRAYIYKWSMDQKE